MLYVAGLDIGSTYTKAIALNDRREVVGTAVRRTGFKLAQAAEAVFEELLKNSGLERSAITYVAATGYGRYTVPFRNTQVTELTAHAQAAVHLFPDTRTILDIGGQDIKAIKVDAEGRVKVFRLNDKCAAGTGRVSRKDRPLPRADHRRPRPLRAARDQTGADQQRLRGLCRVGGDQPSVKRYTGRRHCDGRDGGARRPGDPAHAPRRHRARLHAHRRHDAQRGDDQGARIEPQGDTFNVAPNGLGQLNGAYGAAFLGLRRVEKLLAEGKPIPPTAGQQGAERHHDCAPVVGVGAEKAR